MTDQQISRLTDGQRECLRLVYARLEIKEIARELGISVATVNQRLAGARRALGVSRSLDAARLLAAHEHQDPYISPLYRPNSIGAAPAPAKESTPKAGEEDSASAPPQKGGFQWPFATAANPRNEMSTAQRIGWAFGIAAATMIAFAVMVSALDTMSRMF